MGNFILNKPKKTIELVNQSSLIENRPTMALFGNSISAQNFSTTSFGANNNISAHAHVWWAMSFLGWPFQWVDTGARRQLGADSLSLLHNGVYGWGGAKTSQMLPYLPEILQYNPDVIFLQIMENDVLAYEAGTTLAALVDYYEQVISLCKSKNCFVVWIGSHPVNNPSVSAAYNEGYWALQNWIINRLSTVETACFVPIWDLYSDPTAARTLALDAGTYANYVQDSSVHPQKACPIIGERIANVLDKYGFNIINTSLLPAKGNPKLLTGGEFLVSGGTLVAPATGDVPALFTCGTSADSCVGSLLTENGRNVFQFEATKTGAISAIGSLFYLRNITAVPASGNFAEGDLCQAFADLEFVGDQTNLRNIYVQLRWNTSTIYDSTMFDHITANTWNMAIPSNKKIRLMSAKVPVPAIATSIYLYVIAQYTSSGTDAYCKCKVYNAGVVNYSN